MTELQLLKAIGYVQDAHILDADEMPAKRKSVSFSKPLIRAIAAVAAVAIAVALFLQTSAGAAAAEMVREKTGGFLDSLFPPKEQVAYIDGEEKTVPLKVQGQELEDTFPNTTEREVLVNAMRKEIAHAQEQEEQILKTLNQAASQADMNGAAYERNALWLDVHNKLWTALEQTLDQETMDDLTAEHFQWSTQKRIETDLLLAELGGGSLSGTVADGENARRTKERVLTMLAYLEGESAPAARTPGVILSPEAMVEEMADAYFSGDHETIRKFLSDFYFGTVEVHSSGTEVVNAMKGLDNIPQNMAQFGCLYPSVEYRKTPDSDSYTYLSMTLVWENEHWAISFYGLEG